MSSYQVLHEVSRTLRATLWEEFRQDSQVQGLVPTEEAIVFTNPTESLRRSENRLSIWLYKIDEDQFTRNQPRTRNASGTLLHGPPLTLDMSYLVTPLVPPDAHGGGDLILLGKTIQVLHERGTIPVHKAASGISEDLRVSFRRLTLEELTRVWEALREPYRLSVCYQIRVTHIHDTPVPGGAPITARDSGATT